ncbi:LOW QUALITY PROTEIN: hypothetical protein PoB_006490100 [Plakobranchus ocellatus]|uniref:Uncharacterized protein n=1 Tax=Plakobranchus ocellatus TaxID=259542 RepID=A0AAV4D2J4_9GAST|nr:LOW QUALITY PROTEIN: hypothetical protein PoB_006490100 [Plakobranchus ocellatus]
MLSGKPGTHHFARCKARIVHLRGGPLDVGDEFIGKCNQVFIGLNVSWSKHDNGHVIVQVFVYIACPQQDDLKLSGAPSGQGVKGEARTRDRMVLADLKVGSLSACPCCC